VGTLWCGCLEAQKKLNPIDLLAKAASKFFLPISIVHIREVDGSSPFAPMNQKSPAGLF
jgi:hypothetical protein